MLPRDKTSGMNAGRQNLSKHRKSYLTRIQKPIKFQRSLFPFNSFNSLFVSHIHLCIHLPKILHPQAPNLYSSHAESDMDAADRDVERLITTAEDVEYLEPVISSDLIRKFPHNSTFGFDYSQSSIWSPLIPRAHIPDSAGTVTPKKLSYGCSVKDKIHTTRKKIAASSLKFGLRVTWNSRMKKTKKNLNRTLKSKSLDFSPTQLKGVACVPLAAKVNNWKLPLFSP